MDTFAISFGNRTFPLRPRIDLARLEQRLVEAMRAGAGVVRIPLATGKELAALVTPAVPVVIEPLGSEDDQAGQPDAAPTFEPPIEWFDAQWEVQRAL